MFWTEAKLCKPIVERYGMRVCFFKGDPPSDEVIQDVVESFLAYPQHVGYNGEKYRSVFFNDFRCDKEVIVDGIRVMYKDGEIDVNSKDFREHVKHWEQERKNHVLFFLTDSDGHVTMQAEYDGDE